MNEITEEKQIVGRLYTTNGEYDLLDLAPVKKFIAVPDTYAFYVLNVLNYATHVMVKGDFLIEHYPVRIVKQVHFVLEDQEEVSVIFPSPL